MAGSLEQEEVSFVSGVQLPFTVIHVDSYQASVYVKGELPGTWLAANAGTEGLPYFSCSEYVFLAPSGMFVISAPCLLLSSS